jgi:hypothetical protein
MERRINKRFDSYVSSFKDGIRDKATELGVQHEQMNNLLQFIYDYERFALTKEDFMKRKRVKNVVPYCDRCGAKRASGEQCTRRKKEGDEYCGTHMKGTPHGVVDIQEENKQTTQKIEVWAQDIQGIVYYIDKNMNVYQAEDIVSNKTNPKIIAKYVRNGENYSIPEFGI